MILNGAKYEILEGGVIKYDFVLNNYILGLYLGSTITCSIFQIIRTILEHMISGKKD